LNGLSLAVLRAVCVLQYVFMIYGLGAARKSMVQ